MRIRDAVMLYATVILLALADARLHRVRDGARVEPTPCDAAVRPAARPAVAAP